MGLVSVAVIVWRPRCGKDVVFRRSVHHEARDRVIEVQYAGDVFELSMGGRHVQGQCKFCTNDRDFFRSF